MKNNKKGFTLAELLVVVAIIAVLVAIAIPVFSSATVKAEQAADEANIRAWYAEQAVTYLTSEAEGTTYTKATVSKENCGVKHGDVSYATGTISYTHDSGTTWTMAADDAVVK